MSVKRLAAVVAALLVTIPIVSGLATAAPPSQSKDVVVVNAASQPVPVAVQDEATVPTVVSGQIDLGPNEIHGDQIVQVPAGKQFVVEYISVVGFDWNASVEEDVAQVRLTDLGPPGHPFLAIPVERNSEGRFAGSEQVLWTVDRPFVIRVDLDRHTNEGEIDPAFAWSLGWTVSGYLVDA